MESEIINVFRLKDNNEGIVLYIQLQSGQIQKMICHDNVYYSKWELSDENIEVPGKIVRQIIDTQEEIFVIFIV